MVPVLVCIRTEAEAWKQEFESEGGADATGCRVDREAKLSTENKDVKEEASDKGEDKKESKDDEMSESKSNLSAKRNPKGMKIPETTKTTTMNPKARKNLRKMQSLEATTKRRTTRKGRRKRMKKYLGAA